MVEDFVPIVGILVPLSAIVLGIGLAFWSMYLGHQRRRLQYQERQLMIEKGMVPPPALVEADRKKSTPDDSLRRGTILLCLGIGLALGATFLSTIDRSAGLMRVSGLAAAIIGSLGVGNLVYYFIARRKPEDTARTL